jgi:apolipoprotein N-acyltransferase
MNSPETSGLGGRVSRHRLIAGMASGILLWTAFPPLEWSGLAWIALAPLFWLATVPPAGFPTYVAAWAGGLVFWLFALQWVRLCDPSALFGWVLMALVLSLWWPAFLGLARWAVFRLRLPLIVAAPIIWVGIEFGRAYFLSGFPWYYLAHTQYRRLYLIQVADCTGALGISVLIATVNALLVDLLSRPLSQVTRRGTRLRRGQNLRLCLVTVLLGTALCYGAFRVSTAAFRDGPRLALLQSDVPQQRKMKGDPTKTIDEFVALVDRAAGQRDRPDLIVWPETSYPYGFVAIETSIDPGVLERQVRSIAPSSTVERWRESGDRPGRRSHAGGSHLI